MNDEVYTISNEGAARIAFYVEWKEKEAPQRGLRYPWAHKPDIILDTETILAKIEGIEVPAIKMNRKEVTDEEMCEWKKERDEYMRQRDEWLALKIFHEFGYEAFLTECRAYGLTETFKNSVFPCESHSDS